jgi:hypothetical protein
MAQHLPSFRTDMTARVMRAVCILSFTGLAGGAYAADNIPPAANSIVQPSQPAVVTAPPHKPAQTKFNSKASVKSSKPHWSNLTPAQQHALAPLAADWDKIDALRKEKWLAIANKFALMNPEEQQRVQDRMRDWAKLTPAQRRAAREAYARTKKLNANQKSQKWQQYQSLPEEEKKRLAAEADAKHKKRLANLPRSGANRNKGPTPIKSVTKPTLVKPSNVQPVSPQAQPAPAAPQPTPSPSSAEQSPTK